MGVISYNILLVILDIYRSLWGHLDVWGHLECYIDVLLQGHNLRVILIAIRVCTGDGIRSGFKVDMRVSIKVGITVDITVDIRFKVFPWAVS